jgi:hypothetical protein
MPDLEGEGASQARPGLGGLAPGMACEAPLAHFGPCLFRRPVVVYCHGTFT